MQVSGIEKPLTVFLFLVKIIIKGFQKFFKCTYPINLKSFWWVGILWCISFYNSPSFAQTTDWNTKDNRSIIKEAERAFEKNNFERYLQLIVQLPEKYPYTALLNLKAGISLYNLRELKQAKAYLIKIPPAAIEYAQAQLYIGYIEKTYGNYPQAENAFKAVSASPKIDSLPKLLNAATQELSKLRFASLLRENPSKGVAIRLSSVNSDLSDLAPIQIDSLRLFFSSIQEDSVMNPEYGLFYFTTSRIKESYLYNDLYREPTEVLGLNSTFSKFINGNMDPDRKDVIYLFKTDINGSQKRSSIYQSKFDLRKAQYKAPELLNSAINERNSENMHPFVSKIKLQGKLYKALFFTSTRSGGMGGKDIWYSLWDEKKNNWSAARNAGRNVNSEGNECTPFFDDLNQILYYSSDTKAGLGDYDIFSSKNEEGFINSLNLGYPINTGFDETYFNLEPNSLRGFMASNRPREGEEDLTCCDDIFQVFLVNKEGVLPTRKSGRDAISIFKPALTLYFNTDERTLSPENLRLIDSVSTYFLVNKHRSIIIKGHTDNVGSEEYNKKLSEDRAEAAFKALLNKRIDGYRITKTAVDMREPAIPYSKLNGEELETARKFNRRVEIYLINQ